MEEHERKYIDDRGRLKLPANVSEYLELSTHEADDAVLTRAPETVLDFSVGEWRLWSTEELFRSFDDELKIGRPLRLPGSK